MKLFSINKSQSALLTTIMVLIGLGAVYFFIYLPSNEKRIQEQRFSALQNIDRNIHTKIENSIALMNNLITGYQNADDKSRKKLMDYIKNNSSINFTLTAPVYHKPENQGSLKDSLNLDSFYSIKVNDNNREITLFYSKKDISDNRDPMVYKIAMKFSFEQFIAFLLPKDVFDEYIVFSKGKPVFESFPAGISYVKEDSLLSAKDWIGSSGIRNQVISGKAYKMFLQPVGFNANTEWIIGGLLSDKNYQNEKTQLPTQMILLLSTILLISMLAFPWLKLYQMGSKDRLTLSDGIATVFISMLLISLIFFVFFNYNRPFRPVGNKDSKITLANGINNAFKSEIDSVLYKLEQIDTLISRPTSDINPNKNSIAFSGGQALLKNSLEIKKVTSGFNITQVFWLNNAGDEMFNWTVDNIYAPHGNFKSREYFKKIDQQREYLNDREGNHRFFLDQVISWSSGDFTSIISIKSKLSTPDSLVVAALSFNFRSLDKVILPTGYLFAITENSGNVLYHSEPSRNLNENLLGIFSNSKDLKSCLDAKVSGSFYTKYFGKDYEVQVKPINGLPYFIIIFEDTVYKETSDMEIYSFTFSMLFFFFGFMVLQLSGIFLVSAKRSFLKKQFLDTSWVGPKIFNHKEYILSALFNGIIILLLTFFLNNSSFLSYLFMLLFSVMFIPLFLNNIFEKKYLEEKRNVSQFKTFVKFSLWGCIGILAIVTFKLLDFHNFIRLLGYEILVIFLGWGVYVWRNVVYTVVKLLKNSKKCSVLFGKWNYINSFTLMVLTRLIITSGLPVVFFFISSHNFEQNVSIRYRQFDFVNRLVNKFPGATPETFVNAGNKWNGLYYDSNFISQVSVIPQNEAMRFQSSKVYSSEASKTIELLELFRLHLSDKAISEEKFNSAGALDSSFFFNDLLDEACANGHGTITYRQSSIPTKYLKVQSEDLNYHFPSAFKGNIFNGTLFWILFTLALFIFYFIVSGVIRKLFSLNLPDLEVWNNLDHEILINKYWDQPLFVIGLPGAGKKKYLLDKISSGEIAMNDGTPLFYNHSDEKKNNVFIAELINIPSSGNEDAEKLTWDEYTKKVFEADNRIIIVNHFEYNIQDSVSNRFKLEFLERLYLENKCKIVILSTIHPVAFLDSAMDYSIKQEDKSIPGQDLERWHVLLGHYLIVVLPLQLCSAPSIGALLHGRIIHENKGCGIPDVAIMIRGTSIKTYTGPEGQFILPDHTLPFTIIISMEGYYQKQFEINGIDKLLEIELAKGPSYVSAELLRQETNLTYFLKKTQQPAFEAGKKLTETTRIAKFDELAFKLQVSSHYFYMYIWQSLTKEEKFLLYDLAEDNLVNSFDDYNLSMLIAKGVVIRPQGTLELFNKGFRNFILTAIGNSEAMKIKNQIKDNGNWSTLKNPLQLVILAILAFLLISQEEAFTKLITYIAALGAGVPTVLKLLTLFDKNSQKSS